MRAPSRFPLALVSFCFGALPFLLGGCRSHCDLVEAELRTREMQMHLLRDDLGRLGAQNEALERELRQLREGTSARLTPEEAAQTLTLRRIVLGRQTGGLDDDGQPGDEALQVLVEPRDADGHTLKTPGTLLIRTLEISQEGMKKPHGSWQFSGEGLRRSWRSGLLSTGYYFVLPWKAFPSTEKMRVVATFILGDGRSFEAERDVTIRLVPPELRKVAPAEIPDLPPAGPWLGPEPQPGMPKLEMPGARREDSPVVTPVARSEEARRTAHWQKPARKPLSEAVEILTPVTLPQRVEWNR